MLTSSSPRPATPSAIMLSSRMLCGFSMNLQLDERTAEHGILGELRPRAADHLRAFL